VPAKRAEAICAALFFYLQPHNQTTDRNIAITIGIAIGIGCRHWSACFTGRCQVEKPIAIAICDTDSDADSESDRVGGECVSRGKRSLYHNKALFINYLHNNPLHLFIVKQILHILQQKYFIVQVLA
jgi:hypothetical protein